MDSGFLAAIIGAVVGGVIAISGSIGQLWWAQQANDKREQAKQQQLIANVRLLLHIEIQQNIDAVASLWERISTNLEGTPEELAFEKQMRFVGAPLPPWPTLVWEHELEMLPLALSPTQIRQVSELVDKLARLRENHRTMVRQLPNNLVFDFEKWFKSFPPRPRITNTGPLYVASTDFCQKTEAQWRQCEGLMNELSQFRQNNPIPLSPEA